MKHIAIFLLAFYKYILSPLKNQMLGQPSMCRYQKTCSAYAIDVIKQYGIMRGGIMAFRRFLSCSPLTKQTYASTNL
jgi:uncharacterized protein